MSDDRTQPAQGRVSLPQDEAALEAAFAAARGESAAERGLPGPLMARILADAEAARPPLSRPVPPAPAPRRRRAALMWAGLARPGWGAAGGAAACALVGLWLGYAPPPALAGVAGSLVAPFGAGVSPADLLVPLDAEPLDV